MDNGAVDGEAVWRGSVRCRGSGGFDEGLEDVVLEMEKLVMLSDGRGGLGDWNDRNRTMISEFHEPTFEWSYSSTFFRVVSHAYVFRLDISKYWIF